MADAAAWPAHAALPPSSEARRRMSLLEFAVLILPPSRTGEEEREGTRIRVHRFVQQFPGLHQREIARQLDIRPSHAEHHLRYLERAGLMTAIDDGGYRRYYARDAGNVGVARDAVGAADKRVLALLRQRVPLTIVGVLLRDGPTGLGDLAQAVRISPGTLTYQMKKLTAAGLVVVETEGRGKLARIAEPERTAELLLRYEPTGDLVEGFEDLWADVGL